MDYQIISKGYYSYPQSNEQIAVKQYMFALKDDKKCLLLRFANNEEGTLSGIHFLVQELDDRGNKIGEQIVKANKICCYGGETFSVNEDVFVHDNCTDFKVVVLAADFGDYKYSYKKDNVSVSYDPVKNDELNPEIKKSMGLQKKSITTKNFKFGGFLLLITVIVIIAALGITWFQLDTFIDSTTVFTMDNIEYEFANGTIDSGQIIITDYNGYETNVTIPKQINDLQIVAIKNEAFAGKKLTSVKIEGSVAIGDSAFAGCDELKTIDLGSSTTIGSQAFSKCSQLESISSSSLLTIGERAFEECLSLNEVSLTGTQELVLGDNAFKNCSKLTTVNIEQPIKTQKGFNDLFTNDIAIEHLSLKSLSITDSNTTLHAIYGNSYLKSAQYALKDITIGHLDAIYPNFFINFANLESVTILNLDKKSAGASAFENCYSLTNLNFDDLTVVGEKAFANAAIKSINVSKLDSIGEHAFDSCSKLDIDLSKINLSAIPSYAFAGCSAIKNISIPQCVTNIESYAFYHCYNVETITIPNSVESIGLSAFEQCSSLKSISLPFTGNSKEVSKMSHNYLAYIFGNGNSTYQSASDVKVPSTLKTVTLTGDLTSIEEDAFRLCSSIETITIPSSVITLQPRAFYGCSSLKEIALPKDLKSIGQGAFYDCSSLTSVYIPSTVNSISNNIFNGCESLNSVSIPYIGSNKSDTTHTFKYFFGTNENSAIVPNSIKTVVLLDAISVPSKAFQNIKSIESITLSSNVASIGDSAFSGCESLVGINLTSQITTISDNAFKNSGIQSITIPSNITSIGNSAFESSALKSVSFPTNADYILDSVGQKAFYNTQITSLQIPNITTVGKYAFAANKSLTSLAQSEGSTFVSESEFEGCENLTTASLASSLTFISNKSFKGCSSLETITIPFVGTENNNDGTYFASLFDSTVPTSLKKVVITNANIIPKSAFANLNSIKEISINNNVTSINQDAFNGCSSLNFINIPASVLSIGANAFTGCFKLVEVINETSLDIDAPHILNVYDNENDYTANSVHFTTNDGFEFFRAGANSKIEYMNKWFLVDYNHSNAQNLTLPSDFTLYNQTITSYNIINYFANGDKTIVNIETSPLVEAIETYAFANCSNLQNIKFESNSFLATIGDGSFIGCNKLDEAMLPNGVTSIGKDAFYNCDSMTAVILPSTLSTIGNDAFANCKNLFDVYNLSSLPITKESTDHGKVAEHALLVHDNTTKEKLHNSTYGDFIFKTNGEDWFLYKLVSGYSATSLNLCEFVSVDEGKDNGKTFKYSIVKNVFNLIKDKTESITVSSSVLSIPSETFMNFTKLTNANLSNAINLSSIDDNQFMNCSKLVTVSLPGDSGSLVSVGNNAFKNCYNLISVSLPSTVSTLGSNVFEFCYALENVDLPNGITSILNRTFAYCFRLYNIVLPSTLESIGSQAFICCYGLSQIILPTSLTTIEENAFARCSHLFSVVDLSTTKVAASNSGNVTGSSKETVDSLEDATVVSFKSVDGFYYVNVENAWSIYSISGQSTNTDNILVFPKSFTYGDTKYSSYSVLAYSLTYPQSQINKIIATSSITLFASPWYNSASSFIINSTSYGTNNFSGDVYYEGDAATFTSISKKGQPFDPSRTLHVYASCVHESNQWTYIDNDIEWKGLENEISTTVNSRSISSIVSTDCSEHKYIHYTCDKCGEEVEELDEPGQHDLDENDKCNICGLQIINSSNYKTKLTIADKHQKVVTCSDSTNGSTIIIANINLDTVTITYTATEKCTLCFSTTQSLSSYSTVYLKKNGKNINGGTISESSSIRTERTYDLNANDTFTIALECKANALTTVNDNICIYDLRIKQK